MMRTSRLIRFTSLTPHRSSLLYGLLLIGWLLISSAWAAQPKFYKDDPVWNESDPQDASGVKPWEINLVYDFVENFFIKPGDRTPNVRAQNVNTMDEVPDSSWFTNRIGFKSITAEEIARGPNTVEGPVPGRWTVVAAKTNGVSPGFTIRDSAGQKWFIKFDPPRYLGMATGTEVVVTKLLWALGYHVAENYIAALRLENLVVGEGAKITPPSGNKRQMRIGDIRDLLHLAARNPDGSYRIIASKALPGQPLGGFRFYGTRPDDPNDVIPHEHHRELRGYGVFSAWLNHVDSKSINTLDTLVTTNGKSFVMHHLLDFGSTLGSASLYPREYWEGYEGLYEEPGPIGRDAIRLGFHVEPWRRIQFYKSHSIGRLPLDNRNWDPGTWMPREPNPAFLRSRADDKFWAARKLMALTDDLIRAAVKTGEFHDPKSEEFLASALIQRRDAIGKKYLTAINPIVNPALDSSGVLTFANAAVAAGFASTPESYRAVWYRFDNNNGQASPIGETTMSGGYPSGPAEKMAPPAQLPVEPNSFVLIEISAKSSAYPSWEFPVRVYFRRIENGWELVGLERGSF